MINLNDVDNIEGNAESEEDYYGSLQRAINSLEAWKFQGHYGRSMMDAIKAGRCMLGQESTHDYWGNFIPSRDQVEPGTKGSYRFVAEHSGAEWADMMRDIP